MTIVYTPMAEGQEDAVAALVRRLPVDLGYQVEVAVTGETLRQWQNEVRVMTACESGTIAGVCLWFMCYSTWRGIRGMHVSDLYVEGRLRGKGVGEGLLRAAAVHAARDGARFIKLEVSATNPRPPQFYRRLGFDLAGTDRLMFLEPDEFTNFTREHPS